MDPETLHTENGPQHPERSHQNPPDEDPPVDARPTETQTATTNLRPEMATESDSDLERVMRLFPGQIEFYAESDTTETGDGNG